MMGNDTSRVQTRGGKRPRSEIIAAEANAPAPVAAKVSKNAPTNNAKTAANVAKTTSNLKTPPPQEINNLVVTAPHSLEQLISKQMGKFGDESAQSTSAKCPTTPSPLVPVPDEHTWKDKIMPHLPRCRSAECIRESSFFAKSASGVSSSTSRSNCLRRLLQELVALDEDLPDTLPGIWLRYDEECPQFLRCLMAAPQGTPYALGLFCFDMLIPDSYPSLPPQVQLLTTGGGSVRFSPNLYADGKVCLSLLGTWSGPKWNPLHSSLLQVLMSIQGLILGVQHPYYLEPGHGGWEGQVKSYPITTTITTLSSSKGAVGTTPPGQSASLAEVARDSTTTTSSMPEGATVVNAKSRTSEDGTTHTTFTTIPVVDSSQPLHVQQYEDKLRIGTIKYAMLDILKHATNKNLQPRHYLYPFKEMILCHFYHCRSSIIATVSIFANAAKSSTQRLGVKYAADELGKKLIKLHKPSIISIVEEEMLNGAGSSGDMKISGSVEKRRDTAVESVIATKRKDLDAAVAKRDYKTAARLQEELQHLGDATMTTYCSIEQRIRSKTHAMEAAAEEKDYITAGQCQASLRRLTKNKKILQDLERRMFDAASKLDYVRAGNFQTQFKLLLEQSESNNRSDTDLAQESSYRKDGKNYISFSSYPSSFAAVAEAAASASNMLGSSTLISNPLDSGFSGLAPAVVGIDDGYTYPDDGYYSDGIFEDS
jgi:ubiquitin-protein ligase